MATTAELTAWKNAKNKALGENTIVMASEIVVPKRFTTGSLELDVATGGGLCGNQWTEVVGKESSGKTALCYKTIAANQRLDPNFTTFWLAAEHYDTDQAAALGVDNTRVEVAETQEMEMGLDIMLDATNSRLFDMGVLDSYPALLPDQEADKAMNEATVALGAKLFNQFWRKAGAATKRNPDGTERPFCGVVINQFRDKIGVMYGSPETSPGGHGKDYAFYTRLKVARAEYLTEKRVGIEYPVKVGQTIVVETIKNKGGAPRQKAEFDFYFRNSITTGFRRGDYDLGKEYVNLGVIYGVIDKGGSWLKYDGRQWQGKDNMAEEVRQDAALSEKLAREVLEIACDPTRADDLMKAAPAKSTLKKTRRG